MAATYNVHSLTRMLAQGLNDGKFSATTPFAFTGFSLMSEPQYAQFIMTRIISSEQTISLAKRTTNSYAYDLGQLEPGYFWLTDHTTPFTGEGNIFYDVYCRGPAVWASSGGTATAASISLTGVWVDFRQALADCKGFVADTRVLQFAQSFADGSMSPEQAAAYLRKDEAFTRGAYGA